jgi:hypothetical protein
MSAGMSSLKIKGLILTHPVAWREGNRGYRFTGPGAPEVSRGAREDQIMCIKRGPGMAESYTPEGPWKVVYGCDPAVYQSHPRKCNKAQIAIKCRIHKKWGLVKPPRQRFPGCQRFSGLRVFGVPGVALAPSVPGPLEAAGFQRITGPNGF